MKLYELNYIASSGLSEEELKNLSQRINGFIKEEAGEIKKAAEPSRKKLGYLIKKRGEGFLTVLNLSLPPERLKNLEKKLKAENQILRYLILTKKAKEEIVRPRRTSPGPAIKKEAKPKKVELKEIDQKIEEILKE